ncbi:hypothetical protein ES703_39924 [subsurface metagenome]
MNKTKIEWCDYTVNPIKGVCPNSCWYCYARRMYKRFKWNPEIRLDLDCLDKIWNIKKPSRIFVGSMHEIFGDWISDSWIQEIINRIKHCEKHIFIFLSKNPKRYYDFKFPSNCWLGVTITGEEGYRTEEIYRYLYRKDNIRFISFEPILKLPYYFGKKMDWVIIGGLTGYKYDRPDSVIRGIIAWHRCENVPIFIKPNLKWEEKIQEFPKIKEVKNEFRKKRY